MDEAEADPKAMGVTAPLPVHEVLSSGIRSRADHANMPKILSNTV